MLSDVVWVLSEHAIVIQHQVLDQVHHFLVKTDVEAMVGCRVANQRCQEVKALLLCDEAPLSFEVISLEPGGKTAKNSIF